MISLLTTWVWAAWVGRDAQGAKYVWPWSFSALADEYERRYGLDDAHLRAIGELNLSNAKRNPFAQTRKWSFTGDSFAADDVANPIVEGRLRRNDCSQVTDGAAGLVLVSERLAGRRPLTSRAGGIAPSACRSNRSWPAPTTW